MRPREEEGQIRPAAQPTPMQLPDWGVRATEATRAVAPAAHLNCASCRIRMRASDPAIDLLEARCPICEAALAPAGASGVLGFRLFDLAPFAEAGARQLVADPAAPASAAPWREDCAVPRGLGNKHSPSLP